mmetsp:Transcript_10723/g.11149  ORF Transcript_10723/g.11149 Transcript_10723/m.11149 type:complete len:96 (+) Transcript_10723:2-289(+)
MIPFIDKLTLVIIITSIVMLVICLSLYYIYRTILLPRIINSNRTTSRVSPLLFRFHDTAPVPSSPNIDYGSIIFDDCVVIDHPQMEFDIEELPED